MSGGRTALGLVLLSAGAAALPLLLRATSGRHDLIVRVPSAYELRAGGEPAPDARRTGTVRLGPDPARIRADALLGGATPGLDLLTFRAEYGEVYVREATWPSLRGPFYPQGGDVCGYRVRLGAGLFDTSGAGRGFKEVVRRKLAAQFPLTIRESGIDVTFPPLRSSDLTIALGDGHATMAVNAILEDGTRLGARIPVRLVSRGGTPAVERIGGRSPEVTFEGPVRKEIVRQAREIGAGLGASTAGAVGALIGGPVGWLVGAAAGGAAGDEIGRRVAEQEIPGRAGQVAARNIDRALDDLAFGMKRLAEPWSPDPARPQDIVRLRLAGDPQVEKDGIALPLCAGISIGAPVEDPAISAPIRRDAPLPGPRAGARAAPTIELTLNADALDQVFHYVWQSGKLRALGRESAVLNALPAQARAAAFDFTGLDPRLPPTLAPAATEGDALPVVLANIDSGTMGSRRVMAHALVGLRFRDQGDAVELAAEITDLRVNCLEAARVGVTLTPCLSDLLPLARSAARTPLVYAVAGGDVLAKLPRLSFQGMDLHVSNLRVEAVSRPTAVRIDVQARIEAP